MQQTLSIIKPDTVGKNQIGKIIDRLETAGLKIIAARMVNLKKTDAESFYEIHRGKPFYEELTTFMSSGPILVMVLYGEDAILKNREVMGNTDPQQAEDGTIRKDFGTDIGSNAVHGSDSIENAKIEIEFFFKPEQIFIR